MSRENEILEVLRAKILMARVEAVPIVPSVDQPKHDPQHRAAVRFGILDAVADLVEIAIEINREFKP